MVGGSVEYEPKEILNTVDLIDLSGESKTCHVPANYVHHVKGASAVVSGGNPVVCGGGDDIEK